MCALLQNTQVKVMMLIVQSVVQPNVYGNDFKFQLHWISFWRTEGAEVYSSCGRWAKLIHTWMQRWDREFLKGLTCIWDDNSFESDGSLPPTESTSEKMRPMASRMSVLKSQLAVAENKDLKQNTDYW